MFTVLCGASRCFMKTFKTFIKPFEAPQRSVKIKIQLNFCSSSGIGTGRIYFLYSMVRFRYDPQFLGVLQIQKQPFRGVLRKRFSENMQQIYRWTPMPKRDFNKVAKHGCSPVNLFHIFRTPYPKNTSGQLLLHIHHNKIHCRVHTGFYKRHQM